MGSDSIWEILLPAPQFCSEPKSALKNKVYLKVHNYDDDDDDDTGCILITYKTVLYGKLLGGKPHQFPNSQRPRYM